MRDGLRYRSQWLAEANIGEWGSNSTGDNATKLIGSGPVQVKFGADSKLEPLINEKDGLKNEESGAGNDIRVLEKTNSKKKRSRTNERGRESEDNAKKRNSEEHNEDGKAQLVCRVLRSMSSAKFDVVCDTIGRRTRGRGGFEGKSIIVVKSDSKGDRKNIDGNCNGRSTRGRSGTEDKNVDAVISDSKEVVQKKNIDDSISERTRARGGLKHKKEDVIMFETDEAVQKTRVRSGSEDQLVNLVTFECNEDVQKKNIDGDCIGKRTRGRGVCEHKAVDVVISESKKDVQKKNIGCDFIGIKTRGGGGPGDKSVDEVIAEIKEDIQKKNDDGFIGKRIRGRGVSEDKSLNVVMEETNEFNNEHLHVPATSEKNEGLSKQERPSSSLESVKVQERADVKKGETDQSADEECCQLDDQVREKLKRKRGRPRKTQESNESAKNLSDVQKRWVNQFSTQEIHHSHNKESRKLKRKRGRPPKVMKGNDLTGIRESSKANTEKMKLSKRSRGRPPKAQVGILSEKIISKVGVADQYDVRGSDHKRNEVKDKLKPKHGRPFKVIKDKPGNVGKGDIKSPKLKMMKCHKVGMEDNYKKKAGETGHRRRSERRQEVREKIVELLLGAGWEIQYRPRNGKAYNDAVYVNPEGKTHWSVTLAYRVLKEYFENDTVDSKDSKPGFKFIPVPEEELDILTKVMKNKRSDKNKTKKKCNKEEDEFVSGATNKRNCKMQKGLLGPAVGLGHKMLKGRSKLKSLHHNNRLGRMKGLGTTVSVRGRKGLETHGRKRCGLMVRNSQESTKSDSDKYFLYNGKRTVLTWMIDLGTLALDVKVEYLERRNMQAQRKGRIKTDGIQCDCCSKTFTVEQFETHAGGKSSRPFQNIFLETGSSLLQCQLDSWHKQNEPAKKGFHLIDISGEDPNDDTCGICGDGGDLICCDGCPSTFHKSCLEIKKFPSGPWHCIYCLCKFCGKVGGNESHGSDDTALSHGLFTCCLCEEKYHLSCVQVKDVIIEDLSNTSFCGEKCQELYKRLQMLFGVKHELDGGFSWTFVRQYDVGSDISLSEMPRKVDCNSKVAVALHIMDECFTPIVDNRSGVNLIRNIVYNFGSNISRLNYTGFFTAILERGDEMVAVASIRIHGNQLAEMPFIGTRYRYRRQGMCRRLLSAIEMALCSLNVEKLVIPAISELRGTWCSVFGFKPLEGSSKQVLRNLNMMVFPGVDMLQKPLLDCEITEQAVHPKEGSQSAAIVELVTMEKRTNESDKSSVGVDLKDTSEQWGKQSCFS